MQTASFRTFDVMEPVHHAIEGTLRLSHTIMLDDQHVHDALYPFRKIVLDELGLALAHYILAETAHGGRLSGALEYKDRWDLRAKECRVDLAVMTREQFMAIVRAAWAIPKWHVPVREKLSVCPPSDTDPPG